MTRMATSTQKQGSGKTYTPEETAAYEKGQAVLGFKTRKLIKGESIEAPCTVTVGDSEMYAKTFQGVIGAEKPHRNITVKLGGELEGLTFETMSADNVQNEKTALHKLYVAKMGEIPPPKGSFTYDVDKLEGEAIVLLQKGNARTDGKFGGFFFNIGGFKRDIADSADEETIEQYLARTTGGAVNPTPSTPAPSARTAGAKSSASTTTEDDEPF